MAGISLSTVLSSLKGSKKVKIITGEISTGEGKHVKPTDILTLYGWGIKIYMLPEEIAALRERLNDEDGVCQSPIDSSSYINLSKCFAKHIFVSRNSKLKDNHFVGKTYKDVLSILNDLPLAVRFNEIFFAHRRDESDCMEHLCKGDVMKIRDSSSHDRGQLNSLLGLVRDTEIMIPLKKSVNVTAVDIPGRKDPVFFAGKILQENTIKIPTEMKFLDGDIHATFQTEVGIPVLPFQNKPKFSVCCSDGRIRGDTEVIDSNIHVIKNVRCFDVDETKLKHVTVEIINENPASTFMPAFAKEVDVDSDGFLLYNLYGKMRSEYNSDSSSDDDDDYLEPVPPARSSSPKPPPLPPRQDKPSVTIKQSPKSITIENRPPLPLPPGDIQSHRSGRSDRKHETTATSLDQEFDYSETVKTGPHSSLNKPLKEPDKMCSSAMAKNETDEDKEQYYYTMGGIINPAEDKAECMSRGDDKEGTKDTINVPDPEMKIEEMTIAKLASFLRKYKLDRLAEVCEAHVIDGITLLAFEKNDFENEPFNLNSFEFRKLSVLMGGHRPK